MRPPSNHNYTAPETAGLALPATAGLAFCRTESDSVNSSPRASLRCRPQRHSTATCCGSTYRRGALARRTQRIYSLGTSQAVSAACPFPCPCPCSCSCPRCRPGRLCPCYGAGILATAKGSLCSATVKSVHMGRSHFPCHAELEYPLLPLSLAVELVLLAAKAVSRCK